MSEKVYATSITESVNSSNSTCPLPQTTQVVKTTTKKQFLSRDVTTLYELFSNVPNNNTKTNKTFPSPPPSSSSEEVICYCCERRITKKRCDSTVTTIKTEQEDRKRKFQDISTTTPTINNNKVTSALYYGSTQVRKYMKKVMTRDSWADLLKNGFPCPHRVLWSNDNKDQSASCHHFCTLCDTDQTQDTLRLTLTPSSCRAQDNEIYGPFQTSSFTKNNRNTKKIKFF